MILSETRFSRGHMVSIRKITLEQVSNREFLVTDKELVEEIFGKKEWKSTYICPFPNMEFARVAYSGLVSRAVALETGNILDQDGSIEKQYKFATRDVACNIGKAA